MKSVFALLLTVFSAKALACVDLPFTHSTSFDSTANFTCVDQIHGDSWDVYFDDQTVDLGTTNTNLVAWNNSSVKVFNWFVYNNVNTKDRVVSHYAVNFITKSSDNTVYSGTLNFLASNSGVWFRPDSRDADYRVGACYYNRISLYGFSRPYQDTPNYAVHFEFSPDYKAMAYAREEIGRGVVQKFNCTLNR